MTTNEKGIVNGIWVFVNRKPGHTGLAKVNGKPVLFIYGRALGQLKVDGWLEVITEANRRYPGAAVFIGDQISAKAARVFDGVHTYNPTGSTAGKSVEQLREWARETFPKWVRTAGPDRIACVTVIPGYDDSKIGRPMPRPNTDRHDGRTYQVLWEQAMVARPDWILITSWNEWHEGSEIEPSVENGDRDLRITGAFAHQFVALPPESDKGALWPLVSMA